MPIYNDKSNARDSVFFILPANKSLVTIDAQMLLKDNGIPYIIVNGETWMTSEVIGELNQALSEGKEIYAADVDGNIPSFMKAIGRHQIYSQENSVSALEEIADLTNSKLEEHEWLLVAYDTGGHEEALKYLDDCGYSEKEAKLIVNGMITEDRNCPHIQEREKEFSEYTEYISSTLIMNSFRTEDKGNFIYCTVSPNLGRDRFDTVMNTVPMYEYEGGGILMRDIQKSIAYYGPVEIAKTLAKKFDNRVGYDNNQSFDGIVEDRGNGTAKWTIGYKGIQERLNDPKKTLVEDHGYFANNQIDEKLIKFMNDYTQEHGLKRDEDSPNYKEYFGNPTYSLLGTNLPSPLDIDSWEIE